MTIANTSGQTLFNIHSAVNYYNPLASFANGMNFVFAGKQSPWQNDQAPPTPNATFQYTEFGVFDDMMFGKIITSDDVSLMVNNYTWTSNTVYSMFDDQDPNLLNEQFYVASPQNSNYYVFKCINNNGGVPSTSQPLFTSISAENDYYQTPDGYIWKYMYTITSTNWNKFSTNNYIPVIPDPTVIQNAVNGSIETILVEVGGNNYVSYANGQFQNFAINGNPFQYAIDNSVAIQLPIINLTGTFTIGETVKQAVTNSTGIVAIANTTFVQLSNINGQFNLNNFVGQTSNANATPTAIQSVSTSANAGFYTNCSIYIQSGTGFGQLRNIINYFIVGTQRIIQIDSAFTTIPDFTSHYLICPQVNIQGDGQGAQAISFVNTSNFSISSVQMINVGQNYSWCNVSINGNTGLFGVGSQYFSLHIQDANGSFSVGENIQQGLNNNTGIIANGTVQFSNSSTVLLKDTSGVFDLTDEQFGITNVSGVFSANEVINQLSTGAQANYVSSNSSYIVLKNVNNGAFTLGGGQIVGNTSGATANLAYASTLIGTSSNARATILSISSSAAQARGIISPFGGHGSNPYTELNANKVGVSVTFNNSEGNTIPNAGVYGNTTEYRTVGILSQPLLANVTLSLTSSTGTFQPGEIVAQYKSANVIDSVSFSNTTNYHFTIGNYKTLTLNIASSFAANDVVSQVSPQANGVVIKSSANTVVVRTDFGTFTNSVVIIKNSNTLVNANVIGVGSGFTNNTFGLDSSNNIFTVNTTASFVNVLVNNLPFPDFTFLLANSNAQSFSVNSSALLFHNYTLTNTDIVSLSLYTQQAVVSNSQYVASGIVNFANSTTVNLMNVNNIFITGSNVQGLTSAFTANVSSATSPVPTFNQTTRLTGFYIGANTFNINDLAQQVDPTSGNLIAYGNVQGIVQGANSTIFVVALTNVKGTFQNSNNPPAALKFITTNTVTFEVTSVQFPDLVSYSGNVMYIENIIPVIRNSSQNETNKLVLEFG